MLEATGMGTALLALLLVSGPVLAQSGGSGGHGMGPASAQKSAPAPRYGTDYTPGWSMMSKEERDAHRKRLHELKIYEDCRAYLDQHREQMAQRAQEKGGKALAQPRRDACAGLKKP